MIGEQITPVRPVGEEGLLEMGRQAGEAAVLLRQITLKFGPPDEAIRQRIEIADSDTLRGADVTAQGVG